MIFTEVIIMKKYFLVALVLFVSSILTFAQQQQFIPLVDIATAQKEVDVKTARNEDLTELLGQIEEEDNQLLDEIKQKEAQASTIDESLYKMKEKGYEMETMLRKITDFDASERARLNVLKNNDAIRTLVNTKEQIKRVIYINKKRLEANKGRTRIYQNEVERNTDRIAFLEVAIIKSKAANESSAQYMRDIQAYLEESQTIIDEIGDVLPSSSTVDTTLAISGRTASNVTESSASDTEEDTTVLELQ